MTDYEWSKEKFERRVVDALERIAKAIEYDISRTIYNSKRKCAGCSKELLIEQDSAWSPMRRVDEASKKYLCDDCEASQSEHISNITLEQEG